MSSNTVRRHEIVYALPFSALLLFATINFSHGGAQVDVDDAARSFTIYIRIAIYGLAAFLFSTRLVANLSVIGRSWSFLLLLGYVALSSIWSAYPLKVLEIVVHVVGGSLCAFTAALYYSKHRDRIFVVLPATFAVSVVVSLITVYFFPEIGLGTDEWADITRWQGATGNPNTLGRLGVLVIWFSLAGFLIGSRRWKSRFLYGTAIVAGIVALIGSNSITAQVTVAFVVFLMFFVARFLSQDSVKRLKSSIISIYVILVIGAVFSVVSVQLSEDQLVSSVGRDTTLSGRTAIWEEAIKLIEQKPLLGWGFDGRYSALDHAGLQLSHFHNGYLDFFVRGGVVGVLILIVFFLRLFRRAMKKVRRYSDIYRQFIVFVTALLLYNITETAFGSWTDISWLVVVFIYFMSEIPGGRIRKRLKPLKPLKPQ